MPDKSYKLTVIIATYNRPETLDEAIKSILASQYQNFDLIIADQSEDDKSRRITENYCGHDQRIRYFHSEKGKSKALNNCIRSLTSDIIALTDDDCVVSDDWTQNIIDFYKQNPRVDIVVGEVLCGNYDSDKEVIPNHKSKDREYYGPLSMRHGMGIGANISFKRDVWLKVGGFDEFLGPGTPLGPTDDWDFIYRSLSSDFRLYDSPTIKVVHNGKRDLMEAVRLWKGYQMGTAAFLIKNLRSGDMAAFFVLLGTTWVKFYELIWLRSKTNGNSALLSSFRKKINRYCYCVRGFYYLYLWAIMGGLKSFDYKIDKSKKIFTDFLNKKHIAEDGKCDR